MRRTCAAPHSVAPPGVPRVTKQLLSSRARVSQLSNIDEQSGSSEHNHSTTLVPGRAVAAPGSETPELDSTHMNGLSPCVVINKLSYASPAWWGFSSADDRNRLEAFLQRSVEFGYRTNSSTFVSICDKDDERLFAPVTHNRHRTSTSASTAQ